MDKKIYSQKDVLKKLNIPDHKLEYLFRSGRLDRDNYPLIGGSRLYTDQDIVDIRNALHDVN